MQKRIAEFYPFRKMPLGLFGLAHRPPQSVLCRRLRRKRRSSDRYVVTRGNKRTPLSLGRLLLLRLFGKRHLRVLQLEKDGKETA